MEHLLVGTSGDERLYLGFTRKNQLVTDASMRDQVNGPTFWLEQEITDWQIKPYIPQRNMKKVTMWQAVCEYYVDGVSNKKNCYSTDIFKTKEEAINVKDAIGVIEMQVEVFE